MSFKRNVILFGVSLAAGLTSAFTRSAKKQPDTQSSLPMLYSGTWKYSDHNDHRIHRIQINPDLTLHVDGRAEQATVESISAEELVYLDNFGYHLRIQANEQQPVSLYDEADNATYTLVSVHTTKPSGPQSVAE
ncbi:DUF4828 domain-containing protein [Furfurilactobacillus siliginis]|uniref:DUF4828 domain-containing protein n=1 Tax=Furfurilactobacillus siliginis TaxID=348151 RepID=A0A0R2L9B5_9LACO|nr:DUF4828 domain-containing protein [Furfurilactobacillus siliginis]KRN95341.1 hypothetical protein IV55_GL000328 [Furfurilactobacillus siliginis]GEK28261.1 DUF4828 domain-containing protein [Furfurilactobacillus siliginis]